jgi:hypothetical protein
MAAAAVPNRLPEDILRSCVAESRSRSDFWVRFVRSFAIHRMAEVGVYRGDFARELLQRGDGLTRYYMVDPWRHLDDWNKPANHDDAVLDEFFNETRMKTDFAASKRIILRGKTTEVIEKIADEELDLAYIDADHTLKGITIDLINLYPKIRAGGFLGGDDFTSSIWEHDTAFEPTLVFPFAVYFAEAVGATLYALPFSQFCLQKGNGARFAFVDLTGNYNDLVLRHQVSPKRVLKTVLSKRFPRVMHVVRKMRAIVPVAKSGRP